jgi:lipopolysaccharide transport system ATP-binding protein
MELERDIIIKVENLYKKFCTNLKRSLYYGSVDVARDMLGLSRERVDLRSHEFWALEDVSFAVKRGEVLGVIGQNGSGKTTLLRILNGTFPPDRGRVSVRGRVGALIALGAGFHPHLSGRENIRLNGTILGMSRQEITARFDEIVDFADIGDFLDAPVATYSSGMMVRLGFAIAIHSQPEILLADEILGVGDLAFVTKCFRKIAEYRRNGGAIILVSHGMQLVRNQCKEVVWLHHGRVREQGATQGVCDAYEKFMMRKQTNNEQQEGIIINNDPLVTITKVEFLDQDDKVNDEYKIGTLFKVRTHFECKRKVNNPIFTVTIHNPEHIQIISHYTYFDNYKIDSIDGNGYIDFIIEKLPLASSNYKCTITFTEDDDINSIIVWHEKAHSFNVCSNNYVSYGLVNVFPKWELKV